MTEVFIEQDFGIQLNIYVQPNAASNQFAGKYRDRLKMRLTAKAIGGAANQAACELIANHFKIGKSCVKILRGMRSREKTLIISGDPQLLAEQVRALLSS
jgi:uncharacterized protein (TIGR00251 family)